MSERGFGKAEDCGRGLCIFHFFVDFIASRSGSAYLNTEPDPGEPKSNWSPGNMPQKLIIGSGHRNGPKCASNY